MKVTNIFTTNLKIGIFTIIRLYVDYLLIFGSYIHVATNMKLLLCKFFDMKDLGYAGEIFGIKTTRSDKGIDLDQFPMLRK